MKHAVIVSSVRTAVGKAPKGCLARSTRPDDLCAFAIGRARWLACPIWISTKFTEGRHHWLAPCRKVSSGMNVARIAALYRHFAYRGRPLYYPPSQLLRVGASIHRAGG